MCETTHVLADIYLEETTKNMPFNIITYVPLTNTRPIWPVSSPQGYKPQHRYRKSQLPRVPIPMLPYDALD